MNKEEVINKINGMTVETFFSKTLFVQQKKVIELIEQLDELEKVKIPQFVADWIKVAKPVYSLSGAMVYGSPGVNKWLERWDNQNLFARAWLDGYEVEKEKRYRVKFIQTGQHLAKNIFASGEYFVIKNSAISSIDSFTRKELEEAGFGWVFSCKGVEVKEVE